MVKVPHSKHFTGHLTKKNLINPLTYAFHSGIKTTCMALRHLVVTTETTARDPFRKTATGHRDLFIEALRRTPMGTEMESIGSTKFAKEVMNDGC